MTVTLPIEQESILTRLVALGRYRSREEALADAVRRLAEDAVPAPMTEAELEVVYAHDEAWEKVECALAGQAAPEV
jgi:Arc/MetJ-type ribon-helix-helix transcriptional regulator